MVLLYNELMNGYEELVFLPEIQPRRSEFVAWGLALASLIGLFFLDLGGVVYFWAMVFVVFLFFAALSISLGNWMDRKTQIRINGDGVLFQNGLRHSHLHWADIKSVSSSPARWGEKVQVIGALSHFDFNTLGEVTYQNNLQGKVGFQQGKEIREVIITRSGLTMVAKKGDSYYYSRP